MPGNVTITKAAVAAVSSLFGPNTSALTRPLPGWLRGEPFADAWQAGISGPDPLGALTNFAAVYACVALISGDIAKLQPTIKSLQRNGVWRDVTDGAPRAAVLRRRPNAFQTTYQFLRYWVTCKLLHGNAYALKQRDVNRIVEALYLLDPRRVVPLVTPTGGDVYYRLGGDDLSKVPTEGMVVPASEIIHDRGPCLWHAMVGIPSIVACAWSATQGLRIQQNATTFFDNMSRPSGILTAPSTIDDATAARIKAEFERNLGGKNLGRLLIAGDGLAYEPLTMGAETAQLIEQLAWTVEDVARAFGVPLHMIGAGPMPALNNVEAIEIGYYKRVLQSEIESIEQALDVGLELPAGMRVEMDLGGLMRMDTQGQFTSLATGTRGGFLTPNEARMMLNLPPLTGGDTVYLQHQDHSIEALARRDNGPDPFGTTAGATR